CAPVKRSHRTLPLRQLQLSSNDVSKHPTTHTENSRKRWLIVCRGTRLRDHLYHERRAKSRRGGRLCHGRLRDRGRRTSPERPMDPVSETILPYELLA